MRTLAYILLLSSLLFSCRAKKELSSTKISFERTVESMTKDTIIPAKKTSVLLSDSAVINLQPGTSISLADSSGVLKAKLTKTSKGYSLEASTDPFPIKKVYQKEFQRDTSEIKTEIVKEEKANSISYRMLFYVFIIIAILVSLIYFKWFR